VSGDVFLAARHRLPRLKEIAPSETGGRTRIGNVNFDVLGVEPPRTHAGAAYMRMPVADLQSL